MDKLDQNQLLWEYHQKLSEKLNSLNDIQSKYRLVGSTWLLFGISAIGFIFAEIGNPFEKPDMFILTGLIGVLIGIGLYTIFANDILFYQNLIAGYYIEQKALEEANPWLPQVNNNIRVIMEGKGRQIQINFYRFGICVSICIALVSFSLAWWAKTNYNHKTIFLIVFLILVILVFFVVLYLFKKKISSSPQLEQKDGLYNKRLKNYQEFNEVFNLTN